MAVSRLVLEYDGSGFAGWARQPGQRTVQEEVSRALAVVLRRSCGVDLKVAGRTDAGVHAWGQVASYAGEPARVDSLNALLPPDISVLGCESTAEGFDARRSATSRAYCYRVLARRSRPALERGRVLHWTYPVDVSLLEACAAALVGTHDFTAFTPTETDHVRFSRDVCCAYWRKGPGGVLEFWIEADAFMRQMNRVLVGTMLQVASGRRSLDDFVSLLAGRPRSEAGPTAPPYGLYLAGVGYGGERVLRGERGIYRGAAASMRWARGDTGARVPGRGGSGGRSGAEGPRQCENPRNERRNPGRHLRAHKRVRSRLFSRNHVALGDFDLVRRTAPPDGRGGAGRQFGGSAGPELQPPVDSDGSPPDGQPSPPLSARLLGRPLPWRRRPVEPAALLACGAQLGDQPPVRGGVVGVGGTDRGDGRRHRRGRRCATVTGFGSIGVSARLDAPPSMASGSPGPPERSSISLPRRSDRARARVRRSVRTQRGQRAPARGRHRARAAPGRRAAPPVALMAWTGPGHAVPCRTVGCATCSRAAACHCPCPTPTCRRARVDFLWPDPRLIVEFDSFGFHGHRRAFEARSKRDAAHVAGGYRVIRVTWHQLTREPFAVVANIAAALIA